MIISDTRLTVAYIIDPIRFAIKYLKGYKWFWLLIICLSQCRPRAKTKLVTNVVALYTLV